MESRAMVFTSSCALIFPAIPDAFFSCSFIFSNGFLRGAAEADAEEAATAPELEATSFLSSVTFSGHTLVLSRPLSPYTCVVAARVCA